MAPEGSANHHQANENPQSNENSNSAGCCAVVPLHRAGSQQARLEMKVFHHFTSLSNAFSRLFCCEIKGRTKLLSADDGVCLAISLTYHRKTKRLQKTEVLQREHRSEEDVAVPE